jgi:MinD-like ATPase involved in chromosome partitioning or flagellar assembly
MSHYPVDIRARRRLMEAQRAETQALRAVMGAARKKQQMQDRMDDADLALAHTQAALAAISGLARTAELLEADPRDLRRRIKSIKSHPQAETHQP